MASPSRHLVVPFIGIGFLFSFVFLLVPGALIYLPGPSKNGPMDFERYNHLRTLSPDEFPIDDPNRRVIIVGDIHGMKEFFNQLLQKVAYDRRNDVLVHTGDILTKGLHNDSLWVADFMATHNVIGVRGNHDQEVIEWRGWLDWFATLEGGKEWLSKLHSKWHIASSKGQTLENWVRHQRKHSHEHDAEWWSRIPESWIPFGDHYSVAEDLTQEEYDYLVSLPLKLHIPSAHAFIVHAGLLPQDVRYDYDHKRQPLARLPHMPPASRRGGDTEGIEALRGLQELALLQRVPQNTQPWVNLNMRNILDNNEISRHSTEGTYWTEYWNDQMARCGGFVREYETLQTQEDARFSSYVPLEVGEKKLPCYPSTVIYGHTAARGLDINRWSIGLDSGCVNGKRLSALILGPEQLLRGVELEDDDEMEWVGVGITVKGKTIKFGEYGQGKIVQVSCGD